MRNGFMDRNGRMERDCRREREPGYSRDARKRDPPVVVGIDIPNLT